MKVTEITNFEFSSIMFKCKLCSPQIHTQNTILRHTHTECEREWEQCSAWEVMKVLPKYGHDILKLATSSLCCCWEDEDKPQTHTCTHTHRIMSTSISLSSKPSDRELGAAPVDGAWTGCSSRDPVNHSHESMGVNPPGETLGKSTSRL